MAPEPQTPEWWLRQLHGQLVNRRPLLRTLGNYYDGRHNLAFESQRFRETFGGLFRAFADNWCAVTADAVEERLNVEGFRLPDATETSDVAHRLWQDNELDAQSQLAHTECLVGGEAYATPWFTDVDGAPEITVADASCAIVATHSKMHRRRLAGLRVYCDDWGYDHAELFLPDEVYLWRSKTKRTSEIVDASRVQWVYDDSVPNTVDGVMANPLGVVPMVPLQNRPRLRNPHDLVARSEIASVIPIQDAINKLLADMLIASEYASMPQRALLNFEAPTDPETGQPFNPFTPDKKLWFVPPPEAPGDPEPKPFQFTAADLSNYVHAVEMLVQHVASITRTPPHYLNASADRLSGESIKAAETGLVAKTRRKMRHIGESWEEVMRLAGQIAGDTELAVATRMETVWADPESRTEAEHTDAVLKMKALGLPDEFLWEQLDFTPTEIQRIKALKLQADLVAPATQPAIAPAPTPVI